jgi:hypothetical protein
MTTERPLHVHPDDIKAERIAGWVHFDAEDYCHHCGARNVTCWFAPNAEWNEVRDTLRELSPAEILCPRCYTDVYAAAHPDEYVAWEVRRDRSHEADKDLKQQIWDFLDSNPHAHNSFLAEQIAMLLL